MTPEHLINILKQANATSDKDGWQILPEGSSLTLYLAHAAVGLTVNRVEALRIDGDLVHARTQKKDAFAVVRDDIFAASFDASLSSGQSQRRAGFV